MFWNNLFLKPYFSKINVCLKAKCFLDSVLVFTDGFSCVLVVKLEIGEISHLRYQLIFWVFCFLLVQVRKIETSWLSIFNKHRLPYGIWKKVQDGCSNFECLLCHRSSWAQCRQSWMKKKARIWNSSSILINWSITLHKYRRWENNVI